MKWRSLATLVFCASAYAATPAQDFDARVLAECDRVAKTLGSIEPSSLPAEMVKSRDTSIDRLKTVRATQSPLLRLYRLRPVFLNAENLTFIAAHRDDAKDIEHVTALWKSHERSFRTAVKPAKGLAAQAAIAEEASNRSRKMFYASLPYAKAAGPFAGIYYIAEAEGNRAFAKFVESLPFDADEAKHEPVLTRAAVENATRSLNAAAVQRFTKNRTSNDLVGTSSRLKEAREMLDQNLVHGAAFILLEARLDLSRGDNSAAPQLDVDASHDSILALWNAAARENADVSAPVRRDVIPLYKSILAGAPTATAAAAAPVTVTMVRWPYT